MHADLVLNTLLSTYHVSLDQLKTDGSSRKPYFGIRLPELMKVAKTIMQHDPVLFLETNPLEIYEMEIIQTYVIGMIKDLSLSIPYFISFAHHTKDWSTTDSLCQHFRLAKRHPDQVFEIIESFVGSNDEFLERIVAVMILSHFLKEPDVKQSLAILDQLRHPGYYTKMAVAWALATMMVNHSEICLEYMKQNRLDPWTHNKAIQKTVESFRVKESDKDQMKALKR